MKIILSEIIVAFYMSTSATFFIFLLGIVSNKDLFIVFLAIYLGIFVGAFLMAIIVKFLLKNLTQ